MMKVCVVGGGAAGMMAAVMIARKGHKVVLLEKNEKLGKKLYITGKGRCNVTNNCSIQEFLENVTKNPRFLYASLNAFDTDSTISFFENLGVILKTERGKRVYPESDKAIDIVEAMRKYSSGANFIYEKVKKIIKTDCENERSGKDAGKRAV